MSITKGHKCWYFQCVLYFASIPHSHHDGYSSTLYMGTTYDIINSSILSPPQYNQDHPLKFLGQSDNYSYHAHHFVQKDR
jgi:hypothetical protein